MARTTKITKTCTKTGKVYSVNKVEDLAEFFYRDKSQKDGFSPWSKDAERAYNKAYTTGLKKAKAQRKRTMTFVATPEHHSGSNGTQWVHDNMKAFLAKTALIINCEHISVNEQQYWTEAGGVVLQKTNAHEATRIFVNGSAQLKSVVTKNLALFGVPTWLNPLSSSSGDLDHIQFDAPSLHVIGRGISFHTTGDTPDVVPASGLESVARMYAKVIDDVNTMALKDLSAPAMTSSAPAQR